MNTDNAQSTGHACTLQACDSVNGQATPPCAALRSTGRERLCAPPPHDVVHMVHAEKSPTAQSTGQCCELQPPTSPSGGHAMPPCTEAVATVRLRDREPPPQVVVQSPQGIQLDTAQSTGHGSEWHDCVCSRNGQTKPPRFPWCTIERERLCAPPPHDLVQSLHIE